MGTAALCIVIFGVNGPSGERFRFGIKTGYRATLHESRNPRVALRIQLNRQKTRRILRPQYRQLPLSSLSRFRIKNPYKGLLKIVVPNSAILCDDGIMGKAVWPRKLVFRDNDFPIPAFWTGERVQFERPLSATVEVN